MLSKGGIEFAKIVGDGVVKEVYVGGGGGEVFRSPRGSVRSNEEEVIGGILMNPSSSAKVI